MPWNLRDEVIVQKLMEEQSNEWFSIVQARPKEWIVERWEAV